MVKHISLRWRVLEEPPWIHYNTTVSHICDHHVEPLVADVVADADPPPTFHQWHDRGHAMWWGLISPTQRQPRGPQGQHATGQPGLEWPPVKVTQWVLVMCSSRQIEMFNSEVHDRLLHQKHANAPLGICLLQLSCQLSYFNQDSLHKMGNLVMLW